MGIDKKATKRLFSVPSDYTFAEAASFLARLGYALKTKGKTSGSRVLFIRESDGKKILLHKPHPRDVMKVYAVKQLVEVLRENGDINERDA